MDAFTIYLGLAIGYGQTASGQDTGAPYLTSTRDTHSVVGQADIGLRWKFLALEGGYLKLPTYKGSASAETITRCRVDYRSATQEITAEAPYARLNAYLPLGKVEPYAFFGQAWVSSHNHEHEWISGNDFDNTTRTRADYYGVGLQYQWARWGVRAEIAQIPKATEDSHTNTRDMTFGLIGAQYRF